MATLSVKPNGPNFLLFQTHSSSSTIEATQQTEPTQEELEATGTRLLAQNVNWTCTEQDIRPLFEKYGTVLDIEVKNFFVKNFEKVRYGFVLLLVYLSGFCFMFAESSRS